MKKTLLLLTCATAFLTCHKQKDFDFKIDVEQQVTQEAGRLIVTNHKGEIVQVFEYPAGTQTLHETIPYSSCDPENETLDFHWVANDPPFGVFNTVYSSLGIHNGEYVLIRGGNKSNTLPKTREVVLLVDGIPYQGGGWDLEIPGISSWNLNLPNNGDLGLKVKLDVHQSLHLRAKKISAQNWLEYFVPYEQIQDTLYASVADFNLSPPFITLPLDGVVAAHLGKLEMAALSSDLNYFTVLNTTGYNSPPTSAHPGYTLPVGHASPGALRLFTYSNYGPGYWSIDKIFPSGQELRIARPDVVLKEKDSTPGKQIKVSFSGAPDVVTANYLLEKDNTQFLWVIEGSPDRLQKYQLPDLQTYLPAWVEPSSLFADFQAGAIRFDHLDLGDYRSGLPDRSTEVFARAKSGQVEVYE